MSFEGPHFGSEAGQETLHTLEELKKMNYYERLGLSEDATEDEIKEHFREISPKYHPDTGGDDEVFRYISEAYTQLKNSDKRKKYDMRLQRERFHARENIPGGKGGFGHDRSGFGTGFGADSGRQNHEQPKDNPHRKKHEGRRHRGNEEGGRPQGEPTYAFATRESFGDGNGNKENYSEWGNESGDEKGEKGGNENKNENKNNPAGQQKKSKGGGYGGSSSSSETPKAPEPPKEKIDKKKKPNFFMRFFSGLFKGIAELFSDLI